MIPRKGTEPALVEFALETAYRAVQVASVNIPFDSKKRDMREKFDAATRAIGELRQALVDAKVMTWDTPVGRNAEYVLDRTLDMISTAIAFGVSGPVVPS